MKPCTSCGRSIHLLRNPDTDRWMPVDADPTPEGNIRVDLRAKTATVLSDDERSLAVIDGAALHVSHFATCPYGSKHRRRR